MKLFYDNLIALVFLKFEIWMFRLSYWSYPIFWSMTNFLGPGRPPWPQGQKKSWKTAVWNWFYDFLLIWRIFLMLRSSLLHFFVCVNHSLRVHAWIFACALKLSICAKGAQCYLRTKSALTFLGKADSIIQVGPDSLLLYLSMCKFVTTNKFNCHDTVAYI